MTLDKGVLIIGRFAGVHKGHAAVIKKAQIDHPTHKIIVALINGTNSMLDNKRNPMTVEERFMTLQTVLKAINVDAEIIEYKTAYIPDIQQDLINNKNIKIEYVYCGTDRADSYEQQGLSRCGIKLVAISRANDDENSHLSVASASSTQLRECAKHDDFEGFCYLMPDELSEEERHKLFDIIRIAVNRTPRKLKGIPHLDDLNPFEFKYWVKKLNTNDVVITQKLDGTFNMSVTKAAGKLFYSRLSKGQSKVFDDKSLPDMPRFDPLRAACKALNSETVQNVLLSVLNEGESVDIEVLYGPQPNTIEYHLDKNYIVFLRVINKSGTRNYAIDDIINKLNDATVTVTIDVKKFNWNNTEYTEVPEIQTWGFTTPGVLSSAAFNDGAFQQSIEKYIEEFNEWLRKNSYISSMTNEDLLNVQLNKIAVNDREAYKDARAQAIAKASDYKSKIKKLINEQAKNAMNFAIGGEEQEGLVVRDTSTGSMTKIVDKEEFTQKNRHNWKYRELAEDGLSCDDGTFVHGVVDSFFITLADTFGIPMLKNRYKFIKMITDNKYSFHDAVDLFLTDKGISCIRTADKMVIIKNLIDKYMNDTKELLDDMYKDDTVSIYVKERTNNTLAEVYTSFMTLKDKLSQLDFKQTEHEMLVDVITAVVESFSY